MMSTSSGAQERRTPICPIVQMSCLFSEAHTILICCRIKRSSPSLLKAMYHKKPDVTAVGIAAIFQPLVSGTG